MLYKYLKWIMIEVLNFGRIDGVRMSTCVIPLLFVCIGFVKGSLGGGFVEGVRRRGTLDPMFHKVF